MPAATVTGAVSRKPTSAAIMGRTPSVSPRVAQDPVRRVGFQVVPDCQQAVVEFGAAALGREDAPCSEITRNEWEQLSVAVGDEARASVGHPVERIDAHRDGGQVGQKAGLRRPQASVSAVG